jgi:hypothetical protein
MFGKTIKFIAFIIRLAPFTKKDEGIVSAHGNMWLIAMSAHHILGLEKVPRVRLFAG